VGGGIEEGRGVLIHWKDSCSWASALMGCHVADRTVL